MIGDGPRNTTANLELTDLDKRDILRQYNDREVANLLPVLVTVGIFMVVGIVGNVLVVYVYWRKMRDSAKRTFILALAWLDLSVCVVVIPCEIYDLSNQVMFSHDELCKGMRFLEYSTVLSAGFVLISVSFERYYFLCKAFKEFSSKKAKCVCLACVMCAMIVSSPAAVFAGSKTRHFRGYTDLTGSECSMNSEHNVDEILKRFYYYFLFAIFFLCVIVFVVLYTMIGRLLWKYQSGQYDPTNIESSYSTPKRGSNCSSSIMHQIIPSEHNSDQSRASKSSHKIRTSKKINRKKCSRSAGTVVVFFSVTVIFVVSFLPHLIMRLIKFLDVQLGYDRDTYELLYNFVVRSYLISNVTNPFIYSILNKSFRSALTLTFRRWGVCGKGDEPVRRWGLCGKGAELVRTEDIGL